ncbi:MAG TPA: argininosuccinate lyase [Gemmatimonadaceae bacterium]|nr:argininosuccinate lyase [Gemmatimonadaceae bacterium]
MSAPDASPDQKVGGGTAAGGAAAERSHKLWGGRFAGTAARAFEALNNSLAVDARLWPFDIQGSKAWAIALWHAGVLTLAESDRICAGLDAVGRRLADGVIATPSDEDIHTLIDRLLHAEIGDAASKLHTGRSRNDQVATATRLWAIDACHRLDAVIRDLQQALIEKAESNVGTLMPGYTHMQRAQPVSAAHWMLAHFWPLDRDRLRLSHAAASASVLPLGSGALAGSGFPVSRVLLQGTLGFAARAKNSIDAVSDRDFVAELLFALALGASHVSRLAEDLIIYGTSEFGFVRFGDSFSSGSSMMPQKRNPDALELARASAARRLGDLTSMLGLLKGIPSGYNKDLQEDKAILFGAVDATMLVVPAVAGTIRDLRFDTARMRAALDPSMMATDLADHLVERGATFREAHGVVGSLARAAEEREVPISALSDETFHAAHRALDANSRASLDPDRSVARREVDCGTGPRAVAEQLAAARVALRG